MTCTRILSASALLLAILAGPACARDCAPRVRDGWVRLGPPAMPMQAGFGRIDNPCPAPATIVGASSPAYGVVELHESRIVDGVSRMRPVTELRLEPDGAVDLKPGGLHLMLMEPRAPLNPGSRIVVEFALKDGRVLRGEFVARKPGG